MLVNETFLYKNGSRRYKHLLLNGDRTFFTNEETSAGKKYDETLICQVIYFQIDNIYIKVDMKRKFFFSHMKVHEKQE